jgi:hypothetical protein
MNANGTTAATIGASPRRRRSVFRPLIRPLIFIGFVSCLGLGPACSRSGTKDENDKTAVPVKVDPALAGALAQAVRPCLAAHRTPTSTLYTAHLRLDRAASGAATAMFLPGRTPGHEDFEICAVKAINGAAIKIAETTTLPVAFDFGPEH